MSNPQSSCTHVYWFGHKFLCSHPQRSAIVDHRVIQCNIRDITARKLAEKTILRERDFNQVSLDSLPGLFYLFEYQGHFLRLNNNFETVSGYWNSTATGCWKPSAALKPSGVWKKHSKSVKLLLTDIVLPAGLSGPELAKRLQSEKPGLKVVYMSGYSLETIEGGLELGAGHNFIQKPFAPELLLRTLRHTLDAGQETGRGPAKKVES